jgi:CheY-like chemotaxis protein
MVESESKGSGVLRAPSAIHQQTRITRGNHRTESGETIGAHDAILYFRTERHGRHGSNNDESVKRSMNTGANNRAQRERSNMGARRVLIVDDEASVRKAVEILLKFDGHKVEMAQDGSEALSAFREGDFDLVITDFSMPEMNGHELATIMKNKKPKLPIIMFTAYADTRLRDQAFPNVDLIIGKPCSLDELRGAFRKVLSAPAL